MKDEGQARARNAMGPVSALPPDASLAGLSRGTLARLARLGVASQFDLVLHLPLRYDDETERCVGCDLCEAACPSRCIKVVSAEHPTIPLSRYATEFYIDITKCVFCGYCVEACPVNALAMTKMYEYSTADKRSLIFDKAKLYEVGEQHIEDAKRYLYAHNQEKNDEASRSYRYKFPHTVPAPKDS
jgi:NADH-quinone oxidoreductase subunit I